MLQQCCSLHDLFCSGFVQFLFEELIDSFFAANDPLAAN